MSLYNLAYQQHTRQARKADSWPHMWVMCDGSDKNHIAYISASVAHSHMRTSSNGSNHETSHGDVGDGRLIVSGYVITSTGSTVLFPL